MKKTITQHLNLAILFLLSIAFTLNANPKNSAFNLNVNESTESLNTFYSLYEKNWKNTLNFNSDVFWAQKNNKSKKQTAESINRFETAFFTSETIPSGSLVIAMDNTLQSSGGVFNLNSYGLAVRLLHAGIPLKWAIKSGKAKDAIDFTANASRVAPSTQASASRNFISGPLIIDVSNKTAALAIINSFGNNVNVYELTSNATVDIKYTLNHKPKAAVLNEGGNADIHEDIYANAGLTLNTHYQRVATANSINGSSCFTFVSEPHTKPSDINTAHVNSIKSFLDSGGNFLGQCEGVEAYSNSSNGSLLATFSSKPDIGGNIIYDNEDDPYIQIHGALNDEGGSVESFIFTTNPGLRVAYDSNNGSNYKAYVGKLASSGASVGGYVHYLAGHSYSYNSTEVNGQRMLLNALLRPSDRPTGCNLTINSLPEATDDSSSVNANSTNNRIEVLSNDTFGNDGPNVGSISISSGFSANGGAIDVRKSGTPTDPTDDWIRYTPATNFV
ncbi:MAG: hypothetical protein ACJA1B_002712, partial [Polaribacter sp.]